MSVHAPSVLTKINKAEKIKTFFLIPTVLILFWLIYLLAETRKGAIYHVSSTEPLSFCPGNSSCQPGQLCHTMDYLAEHSSEFFSPDHVNITLIFMCGVHNYTKDLTVQNLHSFIMKGAGESRENVIIDHQFVGKSKCTAIRFFNVSFVNITTLTMRCPTINLTESHITMKSSNLNGYPGINESLSFINITGRGSQALLDNCTFKENCFIRNYLSNGIIVSNSTFQSYRHQLQSIITALSSVVTLTGNVNFTNSIKGIHSSLDSSGTAVFLQTTHPELKSSLNITTGATVYFVNLTCDNYGGAVYGMNAKMYIGAKARVIFMNNTADYSGGAVSMSDGMITIGTDSYVIFTYNYATLGGAIMLASAKLIINREANLIFSHNCATSNGGALESINSTAHVNKSGIKFYDNRAPYGGAINSFCATMIINTNISVNFTMNSAQVKGGAINIETGVHPAIIVGNYSKLLFFNNSAFQGGALYSIMPSLLMTTVGYQSSIQFINNTAFDVGGAVYSQSSLPCIFMITDYSAKISFTVFFQMKAPTVSLTSPLTLVSTRPYLQYPLVLSVCVSVTTMVNHSVLIFHTFSLIPLFIVVKPSHCLHVLWVMTSELQLERSMPDSCIQILSRNKTNHNW